MGNFWCNTINRLKYLGTAIDPFGDKILKSRYSATLINWHTEAAK